MTMPPNKPNLDTLLEHGGWVRALAHSLMSDSAAAEDVEQRSWLAALEHPPTALKNPRAWLARVVRNAAGMHRREHEARRRRKEVVARNRWESESRSSAERQPESIAERKDTFGRIAVALVDMNEPYGSILYLRYCEELTLREISERTGIPESTVHSHVNRSLQILRKRLASDMGEDWRSRCLVFAIPLTPTPVEGMINTLTITTTTKLAISVAVLVLPILFIMKPWETQSSADIAVGLTDGAALSSDLIDEPEGFSHPKISRSTISTPDGVDGEANKQDMELNGEPVVAVRPELAFLERYFATLQTPEFIVFTREAVMGADPTRPPSEGKETIAAYRGTEGEFRVARQGLPQENMTALEYLTQRTEEHTVSSLLEGRLFLNEGDGRRAFSRKEWMIMEVSMDRKGNQKALTRHPHDEFRRRFRDILNAEREGTLQVCESFADRVPKWDELLKTHAASTNDFLFFTYPGGEYSPANFVAMQIAGAHAGSMTVFRESGWQDRRLLHSRTIVLTNLPTDDGVHDGVVNFRDLLGAVGDHWVRATYVIDYSQDPPGGDTLLEKFSLGSKVKVEQLGQEGAAAEVPAVWVSPATLETSSIVEGAVSLEISWFPSDNPHFSKVGGTEAWGSWLIIAEESKPYTAVLQLTDVYVAGLEEAAKISIPYASRSGESELVVPVLRD